jgi:hypothetical protein
VANVDDILSKAFSATEVGKLQWELVGRDSFRTQVGKLYLTISRNDNLFTFTIYDDDGNPLETSSAPYTYTQADLYELARRRALKVDDALESLDQQLKDLI